MGDIFSKPGVQLLVKLNRIQGKYALSWLKPLLFLLL